MKIFSFLPCLWILAGAYLYFSTRNWQLSLFFTNDAGVRMVLWMVFGAALYAAAWWLLGFLPPQVRNTLLNLLDSIEAYEGMPPEEREEPKRAGGLFSVRNAVAYQLLDPFGQRELAYQQRRDAEIAQARRIHHGD